MPRGGSSTTRSALYQRRVRPREANFRIRFEVLAACGGSKAEAAKRLHVRRQSLYYRLDQISKLLDVDLDDPNS
jgi:DNA-binding NtrC family response regulator